MINASNKSSICCTRTPLNPQETTFAVTVNNFTGYMWNIVKYTGQLLAGLIALWSYTQSKF